MSKKRFSSNFYEEDGRTITDNGNELTQNEVVDLLNEQQDIISKLKEENEQLRKENVFLAKQRNYWKGIGKASVRKHLKTDESKKISELEKENEQLKSELNDCTVILYSVFGELNYLNYKSDPVILKKYEELFDDFENKRTSKKLSKRER